MIGIYKFTSKSTNMSYIGQSIQIEQRYKQHINEAKTGDNSKWHQAIREQGIENFTFEILEECLPEQLNDREIYWINYYDSYNNGYNSTPGGQSKYFDPQAIYEAWDQGLSPLEISQKLNIGTTTVYNNLIGYANYDKREAKIRGGILASKNRNANNNSNSNNIYQYDLDGNYIKTWPSAKEIQRELSYSASYIGKCVSGKRLSAYNYQWKPYYKEKIEPYTNRIGKMQAVIQYDLQGNEIARYESIAAATKATQCDSSLLRRVCNNPEKLTAGGYKWKWADR